MFKLRGLDFFPSTEINVSVIAQSKVLKKGTVKHRRWISVQMWTPVPNPKFE